MRIDRIDLIQYGCFDGTTIELPSAKADIHILYGPNEAGKSTGLNALGDLLFGIPSRTPFGFRHELQSLRIGAILDGDPGPLEIVRRKGTKNTLLGPDGLAMAGDEAVLVPYLAGADRAFFERMFSLDHQRLQSGGREILEARDDVGQMLFSAGSGIEGLRARLEELRAEAVALWSPRRSKNRKYYLALDRLNEADVRLREYTLSADRWMEIKCAFKSSLDTYAKLEGEFKERSAERDRLSRIRRVHRHVHRKRELDRTLKSLGQVILLPEDAAVQLAAAEREEAEAATAVAALGEEGERARAELARLLPNEDLLPRADEIHALRDRGIEIRAAKSDLPRHEADLQAAENELRRLVAELGWGGDDAAELARRIPPQVQVGVVRTLLTRRTELEADLRARTRELRECEEDLESREEAAARAPEPADVTKLVEVIGSVREREYLSGRVRLAESRVADIRARVERDLAALHPCVGSEATLATMQVPTREKVLAHHELEREWRDRSTEASSGAESLRRELHDARGAHKRLVRAGKAVSPETLDEARARRDGLWDLVKRRQIDGAVLSKTALRGYEDDSENLVSAYECSVQDADALADQRFDNAEAAGRLAELERAIHDLEHRHAECEAEQGRLRERGEKLGAAWTLLWPEAPFEPGEPERMLSWLETREQILEDLVARQQAKSDLETLRAEECDARRSLFDELAALGVDRKKLEALSLSELHETALDERRRRESEAEGRARLVAEFEKAREEVERRRRDVACAREASTSWHERWCSALADVHLGEDTAPEAVEPQLEVIDRARVLASRIDSLRETIAAIRRDATAFDHSAAELVQLVARDLAGTAAHEAVMEVERGLVEAERVHGLREAKATEAKALDARFEEHRETLARAASSVANLMQAAGVDSNEALNEAVKCSDRRRALESERAATTAELLEDGDGLGIDVLEAGCAEVTLNEAATMEAEVQAELEALQCRLAEAAEERSRARDAFEALGGSDAAARAAADREDALADLRGIAARYVRARGSALLLEWMIDRYRRERQAPLLSRAEELFRILTTDSFSGLRVDYDARDRPSLVGIRPGGEAVPVSGLSAGTADQLFLALRIAAIEEYTATRTPLPFVADDLFINFDDERAAAGLRVLEQLARSTQVLLFTHHRHLVDIARLDLADSCHVVDLASGQARMPRKAA